MSAVLPAVHGRPDLVAWLGSHILQALQINPSPYKPGPQEHVTSLTLPTAHTPDVMALTSQVLHHKHSVAPADHRTIIVTNGCYSNKFMRDIYPGSQNTFQQDRQCTTRQLQAVWLPKFNFCACSPAQVHSFDLRSEATLAAESSIAYRFVFNHCLSLCI